MEVARLEAVFTGDDSNFDVVANSVEARQKDLDGTTVTPKIDADAAAAERTFDEVLAELREIDEATARPKLEADAADAQRELERLRHELDQVDGERTEAEVLADVGDALRDLDRAQRALDEIDDTVARPRIDPEGVREFGDESRSIAQEAATSFDGSAESISDVFRDLSASAFAGFGPAGLVAGVAAAAGIGVAIAAVQELAEENTAAKESAAEMATAMVDGTHDARDAFREYATEVVEDNPWTFWADEASTNLQAISGDLEALGALGQRAIGAIASGSLEDLKDALGDANAELEVMDASLRRGAEAADFSVGAGRLLDLAHNADAAAEATDGLSEADEKRRDSLQRVQGALEEQIDTQEDAEEIAILLKQAEEGLTRAEAELALEIDETNRTMEERASGSRGVAQAEFDLADAVANTKATMEDAEASEQDRKEALFELSGNIIDLAAAEEDASGVTEDYNKVIDRNRREFIDAARAAGYTKDEARKLAREYGLIPKNVDTDINGDASGARREGRSARDYLNALRAVIPVTADTSAAQQRVAEFRASAAANTLRLDGRNFGGFADGAVVDYYADGAVENHVAQIAPAGAWRVWAEPETGGEAYIPLAPSKRQRSMEILEETASRMGARVVAQADGSVMNAPSFSGPTAAMFTESQFARLEAALERGAARGLAGHEAAQDRASRYARSY